MGLIAYKTTPSSPELFDPGVPAHATQVTPDIDVDTDHGGDLQAALDAAVAGDVIELTAGSTYASGGANGYQCKAAMAGTAGNEIVIRTSNYSSLPASGTRVTAGDATNMATISGSGGAPGRAMVVQASSDQTGGAAFLHFLGIKFTTDTTGGGVDVTNLVTVGLESDQSTLGHPDDLPTNITFDRCFWTADANADIPDAAVRTDARYIALIDCRIEEIHGDSSDGGTGIRMFAGGPMMLKNCFISASGINAIWGGGDLSENFRWEHPRDIYVTRCHFWKDSTAWEVPDPWVVKNLFEVKHAHRMLVEDCVFESCWADAQQGYGVAIRSVNQNGKNTWNWTKDLHFRWCKWIDIAYGLSILAMSSGSNFTWRYTSRVKFEQCLWESIDDDQLGQIDIERGFAFVMDHCTMAARTGGSFAMGSNNLTERKCPHVRIENNVLHGGDFGFKMDSTSEGEDSLNKAWRDYYFGYNMLRRTATNYDEPSTGSTIEQNQFVADEAAMDFTDPATDDWTLKVTSPGYQAAADGTDMGCDIPTLNTRLSGVT